MRNDHVLLWVRTKRKTDTYSAQELENFENQLRHPDQFTRFEISERFEGDDHLLYHFEYPDSFRGLKAILAGAMIESLVSDWSLTKIGMALAGPIDFDLDADELEGGSLPPQIHAAFEQDGVYLPSWAEMDQASDSVILWVDLDRERHEHRDSDLDRIERALPGSVSRFWHGRSSIAYGFTFEAGQDGGRFIFRALDMLKAIDLSVASSWLLFQVGNESLAGVAENLNPVQQFIWRRREKSPPLKRARNR